MTDRYDIDDGNKCDCDDDNKCGCTYPNNVEEVKFVAPCGCTPEKNCGCVKFNEETQEYYHDETVCKCSSNGECSCHNG